MVHKIGEAKLQHLLMDSFIDDALSVSNFTVADWLEQRYHMLKTTLRRPHLAHVAKNCFGSNPLNWLLQRVPHNLLDESDVTTAVAHCVSLDNFRGAVLLLNNFHFHDSPDVRTMWDAVLCSLPRADIYSAQQLAVGRFTPSQVAESLTTRFVTVHSSKTAKWLIGEYNLTAQQLKANNNSLLFQLIRGSKTSCADWFIRNFAVTLPEVLLMFEKQSSSHIDFPSRETQISEMRLSTWKMLLQRFPGITAETVRQHCMRVPRR
ncbi:hypothetical protein Pelo_19300 [Pelomyxa schiedti]|nr:hypothetical protein Pelo_19300 [Pelomyxa schiedti]